MSKTKCDRIYAAAGTAACLWADGVLGTVKMRILDANLRERKAIPVTGIPNRVRVSPSGRMVAWTLFVGGDSYATLDFSTRTAIYDTKTGTLFKTLETFAVTLDGKPYQSIDVNYWGVTFTDDDNTFYATLYTKRPPLPRQRRLRQANRAHGARPRRMPVALPRRHQDRVQVGY